MTTPKKVIIKEGYVSAYDANRVRRAFEESDKSAQQIAREYGLPSDEVVRYVANRARSAGGRVDIHGMK